MPTRAEVLADPTLLMAALRAPFPMSQIKFKPKVIFDPREQGGDYTALTLFWAPKEACMRRLDEVFGPGGWQTKITPLFDKRAVLCELSVLVGGHWVTKTDIGGERNMKGEDGESNSHKSAVTAAIRRCCTQLGIGVYLANLPPIYWPVLLPKDGNKNKCYFPQKFGQNARYGEHPKGPPRLPDAFLPEEERGKKSAPTVKTTPQKPAPVNQDTPTPDRTTRPPQQAPAQSMPTNGADLDKRVRARDAYLTQQGVCQGGDLIRAVLDDGAPQAGEDMRMWDDPAVIAKAVRAVTAFERLCRENRQPQPANA